jgi:hypothetical protein
MISDSCLIPSAAIIVLAVDEASYHAARSPSRVYYYSNCQFMHGGTALDGHVCEEQGLTFLQSETTKATQNIKDSTRCNKRGRLKSYHNGFDSFEDVRTPCRLRTSLVRVIFCRHCGRSSAFERDSSSALFLQNCELLLERMLAKDWLFTRRRIAKSCRSSKGQVQGF